MNNIPTTIFKDQVFIHLCHFWKEDKRCPLLFLDHFLEQEKHYPNAYRALKWAADGYRLKKKDNETLEWVYPCPQENKVSSYVTKIRVPSKKTLKRRKKRRSTAKGVINKGSEYIQVDVYGIAEIGKNVNRSGIAKVFPIKGKAMLEGVQTTTMAFGRIAFHSFEAAIYTYLQYFDEKEIPKLTQMKVQDHPQMDRMRLYNSWSNPG